MSFIALPSPEDFWLWTWYIYTKSRKMSSTLLDAQDHQKADINLLLLFLWLDHNHLLLSQRHMDHLVEQSLSLRPSFETIRRERAALKGTSAYEAAKARELEKEKDMQRLFLSLLPGSLPLTAGNKLPPGEISAAPVANLKRYALLLGLERDAFSALWTLFQSLATD